MYGLLKSTPCSFSLISNQSEVLYESSDLVGDICSFAGGAFTNYFQIPKITAFIREATLCGFVDPFCLRVPRVYVRHAGSQIWQTWVAEMGEAAENWAEGRTDWKRPYGPPLHGTVGCSCCVNQ